MSDAATLEQLIGPEAAKRLSVDPALNMFWDRLTQDATMAAIGHADPAQREAHRQLVLAISTIRGALRDAGEYDELQREEKRRATRFEDNV
jgi:hypothetical protein